MPAPAIQVADGFPELLRSTRAPGRHLSDVTRSLSIGLGHFADDPDRVMPMQLMQLGLTLEFGFVTQMMLEYPDRYYRVWDKEHDCWRAGYECERDSIWMNLDLLRVDEWPWAVEDVKMTRKSSRHDQDSPKWWEAWTRVKGYAWATGARVGRLWIAYLFDYSNKRGGDVECVCWERRWDTPEGEDELRQNWAMIVRHEKQMAKEGR